MKSKEAPTIKEYNSVEEYGPLTAIEMNSTREYGETFHKEKKEKVVSKSTAQRAKFINTIKAINITSVATGVTVVAIGAVMILNQEAAAKKEDYDISFNSVEVSENMIWYGIDVGDVEDLKIRIYNDGYVYEVEASSGENYGEFLDLEPDTEYKIAVCDEDVIKEIKVKTAAPHRVFTTPLEDITVTYECKCNVDGYFHFTILYEDTENVYYDFSAYLEDMEGNISKCEFIGSFNQEQIIDISNIYAAEEEAKFVVTCKMNNETYTLIEENVRI